MGPNGERWRIDDLARRSGVSVDTIRFYLREELLPPARREGRVTLFGPEHLLRLTQIRDLQARHFNLAAIRRLLEENRLGIVETLFAAGEGAYDAQELAVNAGVEPAFVDRLVEIGLLDGPPYDNGDVQVVDALRGLQTTGIPEQVVVFLARLYVEHFASMQQDVLAVFSGEADIEWPEDDRRRFTEQVADRIATILPLTERLLDHVHHRTVQRMALRSMELRHDG